MEMQVRMYAYANSQTSHSSYAYVPDGILVAIDLMLYPSVHSYIRTYVYVCVHI